MNRLTNNFSIRILGAAVVLTVAQGAFGAGLVLPKPTLPSTGFGSGTMTRPGSYAPIPSFGERPPEAAMVYRVIPKPVPVGTGNIEQYIPKAQLEAIRQSYDPKYTQAPFILQQMNRYNSETAVPEAGADHGLVTVRNNGGTRTVEVPPTTRLISHLSSEGRSANDPQLLAFQDKLQSSYANGLSPEAQKSADFMADVVAKGQLFLIGQGPMPEALKGLTKEEISELVADLEKLLIDTLQVQSATGKKIDGEMLSKEMQHLKDQLFPDGETLSKKDVAIATKGMQVLQAKINEGGPLTVSHGKGVLKWVAGKLDPADPAGRGKEKAEKFCKNCMGNIFQTIVGCAI